MLSALDISFVSCCYNVQFYELLLVLSFRHVTQCDRASQAHMAYAEVARRQLKLLLNVR